MKKICLNFVLRNKLSFYLLLISQIFLLHAPQRVEILRRSASEGTNRIMGAKQLTIDVAGARIEDSPLSARFDDSARTTKIWEVLKILTMQSKIGPIKYDEKRHFYLQRKISSPLSPNELQRVFPAEIDTFLERHALPVDLSSVTTRLYLPGVIKEPDGLCDFGYFEYQLRQETTPHSFPETVCTYRKFNPIAPQEFHLDDLVLQTFDETPLTIPGGWNSEPVERVFMHLAQVKKLLAAERAALPEPHEHTFPTCFLRNMQTLLLGQAKIAIAQAPLQASFDMQETTQKLKCYQDQINASKNRISGSNESLLDVDATKEMLDQVSIIAKTRTLQGDTLIDAWDKLRKQIA
jgi:hypothetical protein